MDERPEIQQPGPVEPRPPRWRTALAVTLAGILVLGGGIGIGWGLSRDGSASSFAPTRAPITPTPQTSPPGSGGTLDLDAVEARVGPAVVDINAVLYGFGDRPGGQAAGTGMILTPSGEVLTNNHVIAGATRISVTIEGQPGTYSATVVGAAPERDVALLQIEGVSGLPTVTLADSSQLSTGQQVAAVGNAFGRGGAPTITVGTITALSRDITVGGGPEGEERLNDVIETDAPVSPGESGGPLVNAAGQVVGIITAGQRSGPFRGSTVSFAIPSNAALEVVDAIRAGRESAGIVIGPAGFLGVEVRNLDPDTAARLGLEVRSGALVLGAVPGTPADRAGLGHGAVITRVDGAVVTSADALGRAVRAHDPGDRVTLTWVDETGTHTATVTLTSGPAV